MLAKVCRSASFCQCLNPARRLSLLHNRAQFLGAMKSWWRLRKCFISAAAPLRGTALAPPVLLARLSMYTSCSEKLTSRHLNRCTSPGRIPHQSIKRTAACIQRRSGLSIAFMMALTCLRLRMLISSSLIIFNEMLLIGFSLRHPCLIAKANMLFSIAFAFEKTCALVLKCCSSKSLQSADVMFCILLSTQDA